MISVLIIFSAIFLSVNSHLHENEIVEKSLEKSLSNFGKANIFVNFKENNRNIAQDLEARFLTSRTTLTRNQRTNTVYNSLKSYADISQFQAASFLNGAGIKYTSFWISNQIYIENADRFLVNNLRSLNSVLSIREEETFKIQDFESPNLINEEENLNTKQNSNNWHLEKMGVPEIWRMRGGNNGTGLIVANIDTGVRHTHESLARNWQGPEGFGWYDPEFKTRTPSDAYNHGTHTMGTLVGARGIGIAPGARWIACKGYRDDGTSRSSNFIACGEYVMCPVDTQGNNRDCNKGAHVVGNSWGGVGRDFNRVLDAWISSGMLSSFSAGNTGGNNRCQTIYEPAAQPRSIAVGSTTSSDDLSGFSSKGPSGRNVKPEISAPGSNIYSASSSSDTAYKSASGTSMSCPCLSGVLALLKGGKRDLNHNDALAAITRTAVTNVRTSGQSCGGRSDRSFPNNHFGHGRVDGLAAYRRVMNL